MTATLTGGKLALSSIPNVEIVTLLLVVYALTMKRTDAIIACLIFCVLEIFIWGFWLWWVILYFIYWPALVITVSFLPKKKYGFIIAIAIGIAFTAFFGVLSTLIEITIAGALATGRFWEYFYYRYAAGIPFFLTHIISNSIILPVLVPILYKTLSTLNARYNKKCQGEISSDVSP